MAVKVSITLPRTLDETAPVGTAELVGSTCWIFCNAKKSGKSEKDTLNVLFNEGQRSTHRTPGTHLSRRCSRCHGHTQSAWEYTDGSGT